MSDVENSADRLQFQRNLSIVLSSYALVEAKRPGRARDVGRYELGANSRRIIGSDDAALALEPDNLLHVLPSEFQPDAGTHPI